MPATEQNPIRNAMIATLLKDKRLSYAVIAEMLNTSRNVVAGVAFRLRHPLAARISSADGYKNMTGTGWRRASYWPEKTAANTR